MKRARVIPILLLKNKGLHKSVRFEKGKYLGDPINVVRIFNDKQCDELVLLDTEISKHCGDIDFNYLSEITSECFMPLSYGGGIRNLKQIEELLKIGIEKVSINSSLLSNAQFVREAVQEYGSSTIVASIDIRKNFFGQYRIYDHQACKGTSVELDEMLKQLNDIEVGEVLVNSVDLDGTMKGYDLALARKISAQLLMPVVFAGGCRDLVNIHQIFDTSKVSGAGVGSLFVFHGPHKGVLISYPDSDFIEGI
jgi:imidazole glycerol-phosphate synthase subunit HisF